MKILIDNGHGHNTPGKRSPDGKFREYSYNREIAKRIVADLIDRGYDAELLVPEDNDVSLEERVRRVNKICLASGQSCPTRSGISPAPTGHPNVILISIHVNAAGDGSEWMKATGWSCYTCKGQTESDKLADCLYQAAIKNFPGRRIRTDYSDNDPDWEEDFYILRHSLCPAVLTENFFMDSPDLEFLKSEACKLALVNIHVEAILQYISFTPTIPPVSVVRL